jgi:hypothetical protein
VKVGLGVVATYALIQQARVSGGSTTNASASAVTSSVASGIPVQAELLEACQMSRIKWREILESWPSVIDTISRNGNSSTIHVRTRAWADVGYKAHVSIGIAAWCSVIDPIGQGVVTIRGSREEKLASVINGNWLSN